MKKLKVVVVGVGHLGRYHAQKLKQIEAAELVALVEPSADRRAAMSAELGVPAVATMAEAPAHEAVVIATPTSAHLELGLQALATGKHVMIEKPVTMTGAEGRKLLAASAERPGQVVTVGHVERFNPVVRAAEQMGDQPWYVVAERLGPFKERSVDIDVIDDLMIHDLDLCLRWFKSEAIEVRAVGVSLLTNLVDMANARIEFANGAVASLTASRSSLEATRKLRWFSARRYLSMDLGAKTVKSVRRNDPPPGEKWPEIEMEPVEVKDHDALFEEESAFVRACLDGTPAVVTLSDAVRAVELAERVKDALRTPGLDALRAGQTATTF